MKIKKMERFNLNQSNYSLIEKSLLEELNQVIGSVDAEACHTKVSDEKLKMGNILYSPDDMNTYFKQGFSHLKWDRARMNYHFYSSREEYEAVEKPFTLVIGKSEKKPSKKSKVSSNENHISAGYDEVDFYKIFNTTDGKSIKVSIEVQFGKYFGMTRDNHYKSVLFYRNGISDVCVSICPMRDMMKQMSSGIGFYEKSLMELCSIKVSHPIILIGISP